MALGQGHDRVGSAMEDQDLGEGCQGSGIEVGLIQGLEILGEAIAVPVGEVVQVWCPVGLPGVGGGGVVPELLEDGGGVVLELLDHALEAAAGRAGFGGMEVAEATEDDEGRGSGPEVGGAGVESVGVGKEDDGGWGGG